MLNNWHKKEKPFLGLTGFGGGISSKLTGGPSALSATGGTTFDDGGYRYHVFTSNDDLVVTGEGDIDYVLVAGGGGGGHTRNTPGGGAGGAGGLLQATNSPLTAGTYPIVIGDGGTGAYNPLATSVPSTDGGNTTFNSLTAYGGGGGGTQNEPTSAGNGGSGGGSSPSVTPGYGLNPSTPAPVIATFPNYTPGTTQGYPGGGSPSRGGGGGGGAGGAGTQTSNSNGGPGGVGAVVPWMPDSYGEANPGGPGRYFAGGGGGGAYSGGGSPTGTSGSGGAGGGGNGGPVDGLDGSANMGGGGGGGTLTGGEGGSGIAVIRYSI